jgi:hypothetical protein
MEIETTKRAPSGQKLLAGDVSAIGISFGASTSGASAPTSASAPAIVIALRAERRDIEFIMA